MEHEDSRECALQMKEAWQILYARYHSKEKVKPKSKNTRTEAYPKPVTTRGYHVTVYYSLETDNRDRDCTFAVLISS